MPQGLLERLERQADRKLMRRLEAGESQRSKTRFALSLEDFEHMRWSTRWWALWCLAFPEKKYMLWRYDPNPRLVVAFVVFLPLVRYPGGWCEDDLSAEK